MEKLEFCSVTLKIPKMLSPFILKTMSKSRKMDLGIMIYERQLDKNKSMSLIGLRITKNVSVGLNRWKVLILDQAVISLPETLRNQQKSLHHLFLMAEFELSSIQSCTKPRVKWKPIFSNPKVSINFQIQDLQITVPKRNQETLFTTDHKSCVRLFKDSKSIKIG